MALAAYFAPHGGASWLWLFVFFAIITAGELYLSPIGLALVARVAPAKILSMMMGLWFITSFTGNFLQGYIGTYFDVLDKVTFFLMCAGIGFAAGVVTWLFNFPLKPILEGNSEPRRVWSSGSSTSRSSRSSRRSLLPRLRRNRRNKSEPWPTTESPRTKRSPHMRDA
jgi:MFS family permease